MKSLSATILLLLLCSSVTALELPTNDDLTTVASKPIRIPDFESIKDPSIRKQAFINLVAKVARPTLHSIEKKRTILLGLYLDRKSVV